MKTNKFPQSEWTDSQVAGSQSQRYRYSDMSTGSITKIPAKNGTISHNSGAIISSGYKKPITTHLDKPKSPLSSNRLSKPLLGQKLHLDNSDSQSSEPDLDVDIESSYQLEKSYNSSQRQQKPSAATTIHSADIPERVFMNGLIKHTAIALAIIVPLAAFSAYAASPQVSSVQPTSASAMESKTTTSIIDIPPSTIIYKSATVPTTVDRVDLQQYAGTWYEIGRLPMYFQRKCVGNVTATYTEKVDGSGIMVSNKCSDAKGNIISADGLAKPANSTGSQLKVTFLPSWIRWLPVGRADYWILARDANYQTALVGTPDKKYLWLLARSPNLSQQTYTKYRQIAQQQGYDLKEFQLTQQSNQNVTLIP